MVKAVFKNEVRERCGEGVYWLVKFVAKSEVSKRGRKGVNRLVEFTTLFKRERKEMGRESGYGMVEC